MQIRHLQRRVEEWVLTTFGEGPATTKKERALRFVEEALELVQARGMTKEEALLIVDYVYSRPAGETFQEAGGVMMTLSALCWQAGIELDDATTAELARVESPEMREKIREKQNSKSAIRGVTASKEDAESETLFVCGDCGLKFSAHDLDKGDPALCNGCVSYLFEEHD